MTLFENITVSHFLVSFTILNQIVSVLALTEELKSPSDKAAYKIAESSSFASRPPQFAIDEDTTSPSTEFTSQDLSQQWWKVDLTEQVYIKQIKITLSTSLSSFYILATNQTDLADHLPPDFTQIGPVWTVYAYKLDFVDNLVEETINVDDVAQVLVLYYPQTTYIQLVSFQVLGLDIPRYSPQKSELIQSFPTSLVFKLVTFDNTTQIGEIQPEIYQIWVEGEIVETIEDGQSNTEHNVTLYDLLPDTQYEIQVTCVYKGYYQCPNPPYVLRFSTTPCQAPLSPEDLKIESKSKVVLDGQLMWKYQVKWKEITAESSDYHRFWGCTSKHPSSPYKLQVTSLDTIIYTAASQAEFCVYGAETFNISLSAINSDGLESEQPVVLTETSGDLAAGSSEPPLDVTLSLGSNPITCVHLTWRPPKHPNAHVIKYMYSCLNGEWMEHSNIEVLDKEICELEGYTYVTCLVKGVTTGGVEGAVGVSNDLYTACDSPEAPTILSIDHSIEKRDGNERVKIIVTLQSSESRCVEVIGYELELQMGALTIQHIFVTVNKITISDLSSHTNYTLRLKSINSEHMYSQETIRAVMTESTLPYSGPNTFVVVHQDEGCITVAYERPVFLNSAIISYKVQCSLNATKVLCNNAIAGGAEDMNRIEQSICIDESKSNSKLTCNSGYASFGGPSGPRNTDAPLLDMFVQPGFGRNAPLSLIRSGTSTTTTGNSADTGGSGGDTGSNGGDKSGENGEGYGYTTDNFNSTLNSNSSDLMLTTTPFLNSFNQLVSDSTCTKPSLLVWSLSLVIAQFYFLQTFTPKLTILS